MLRSISLLPMGLLETDIVHVIFDGDMGLFKMENVSMARLSGYTYWPGLLFGHTLVGYIVFGSRRSFTYPILCCFFFGLYIEFDNRFFLVRRRCLMEIKTHMCGVILKECCGLLYGEND